MNEPSRKQRLQAEIMRLDSQLFLTDRELADRSRRLRDAEAKLGRVRELLDVWETRAARVEDSPYVPVIIREELARALRTVRPVPPVKPLPFEVVLKRRGW